MSLSKETKIRILESFYAIDYVLFGKPLKNVKLIKDECSVCNQALVEEYISTKGAILGTIIELYKLINHKPNIIKEKINVKTLGKMATESAKVARRNAVILVKSPKGRKCVKDKLVESLTENKNVDINKEVKERIRERAYCLALDNLLISRAINESKNYKQMNSWMGFIIEDAYKILRDSLIESAMEILSKIKK